MNNSSFVLTDEQTKLKNLTDVLAKRCRGFVRYDVLMSVVNRLDPKKQMSVDVVNEMVFNQQAKTRTTIIFNNGVIDSVRLQWGRCLLGSIDFGTEVAMVEDGVETITSSTPVNIISTPVIVQLEEQMIGGIDSLSSRLLILI